MSRIGKLPVPIPPAVKVAVQGQTVAVEGPKGKLNFDLPRGTSARVDGGKVLVARASESSKHKALHGLCRSLVYNMVKGVSDGYVKKLEIQGVGFKAAVQGKTITMNLGYSHQINYAIPDTVKVTVEDNVRITIEGVDKQLVGKVAAELRSYYPPEPYKGKGVRYAGEHVLRKEGKTVQ